MKVREAEPDDLDQILDLFENTIRYVNSLDYTQEQVEVWSNAKDRDIWSNKIATQSFYVSIIDDQIVGFSSIDLEGYLDFMYVHKDHQRKGIAKVLLDKIEKQAQHLNVNRIWSSVSKTAQPFFAKHGYVHFQDEHKIVAGVHFKNALMEKWLGK